jgi:imidazoleglycerol-phosphate dehydratase
LRRGKVERKTDETSIKADLLLDGSGKCKVKTGRPFFDHLLRSFIFHGRFNLILQGQEIVAVDDHHLVEDVGIVLGKALEKALGNKKGINRFGSAIVPMDETLVMVAVDLSGRSHFDTNLEFKYHKVGDMSSEMVNHFLESMAKAGQFNLHLFAFRGNNDHHKAEATFKALGRSLADAVRILGTRSNTVPSLKGTI